MERLFAATYLRSYPKKGSSPGILVPVRYLVETSFPGLPKPRSLPCRLGMRLVSLQILPQEFGKVKLQCRIFEVFLKR